MHNLDWSGFIHAYGCANDVPVLLLQARTAPAPTNYHDEPWFSLWGALCHQGNVFSASYAAVPELVAIAEARIADLAAASQCLLLAASIQLERVLPQGTLPPMIPPAIRAAYETALARGVVLASQFLKRPGQGAGSEKTLSIALAALCGNVEEARRFIEQPDDEE